MLGPIVTVKSISRNVMNRGWKSRLWLGVKKWLSTTVWRVTIKFYDEQDFWKVSTQWHSKESSNWRPINCNWYHESLSTNCWKWQKKQVLQVQFVMFHMKKGIYFMMTTQTNVVKMEEIDWWWWSWIGNSSCQKGTFSNYQRLFDRKKPEHLLYP